jgi:hypothetical protein
MISKSPPYHTQDSGSNRLGLREKSMCDPVAPASRRRFCDPPQGDKNRRRDAGATKTGVLF